MKQHILTIILVLFSIVYAIAQVNAGPNDTICQGESTQLQGSSSGNYTYQWTSSPPDPTISNPNILTPTVSPSQTTLYTLEGREVSTVNLVDNGDFEQGFTGFTSDYDYCDQPNCLAVTPSPANGIFGIHDNPNYLHNNFSACNDHSSSGTQMMVCNGDEFNNLNMYETTVSGISANTEYEFSVYLTNVITVVPPIIPQFEFKINNQTIGTLSLSGSACSWTEFSSTWNSGSSTSATITIINTTTYPSDWGNDFAMDDVSLKEVIVHSDQCTITVNDIPTSTFDLQSSACMTDTVLIEYTGSSTTDTTYHWDFGQDAVIVSGSNQGPYEIYWSTSGTKTVSLWVDNGCISDTTDNSIEILAHPDIDVTADATTIPFGTSTTLHGVVLYPSNYLFNWTPQSMLVNPDVIDPTTINLDQTTMYYFSVEDDNQLCSSIDSVLIEVEGGPLTILSFVALPDTICKEEESTLTVIAEGGSENYTFTWESNPSGFSYTGPENEVVVSPDINTIYTVTVDDGFNPTVSANIEIIVVNLTEIISEPSDLSIPPGAPATFEVQATDAISYQWQISTDGGTNWVDITDGGAYSGSQTDMLEIDPADISMNGNLFRCLIAGQCNSPVSSNATLSVSQSPDFISNLGSAEACENESLFISLNCQNFIDITDFVFTIEYDNDILSFENLTNIDNALDGKVLIGEVTPRLVLELTSDISINITNGKLFDIEFKGISGGTTEINWNIGQSEIINASGQKPDLVLSDGSAVVNPAAKPATEIIASRDTINIQEEIDITLEAIGGEGDELVWAADNCTGDSIGSGTTIEFPRPEASTTYYAYWNNQCGKSECIPKDIIIIFEYNVGIPNAFTPNNDGVNDEFTVVSAAPLTDFKMQIFSRNNLLIFESNDQNTGWDGVYQNSPMRTETYIYRISYKVPNKYSGFDNIVRRGVVTLIR